MSKKKFLKEKIKLLKEFLKKDSVIEMKDFLFEFLIVVVIYGLLIDFTLSVIIKLPFNIQGILAWGIVAYLVKAELPEIIKNSFPRMPPKIPIN